MANNDRNTSNDRQGVITFIHHDKGYATIEYEQNGKRKSITARLGMEDKKDKHVYRVGDTVRFELRPSSRGDRMIAADLKFLYNTSLEVIINKARIENRFAGFLKEVDGELYIKEKDSYIFFPLQLSKWEKAPATSAFNEMVSFKLVNTDKPHTLRAELFSQDFTAGYRKALEHFKNKTATEAVVTKISPYAVYVDLFDGEIKGKLKEHHEHELKPGDKIKVKIVHLDAGRIVIEAVQEDQA